MNDVNRIDFLDFLRGIAILSVIIVHASQSFPSAADPLFSFGRFGVQLFFFVSAYTMSMMWAKRLNDERRTRNFYVRRVLRIAPLFWLAIPAYLLIRGGSTDLWHPSGRGIAQIGLTTFFLHGFSPLAINSVVPGGWSIAVEMTFYLIFPLLATQIINKDWLLWGAIAVYFVNVLALTPALVFVLQPIYGSIEQGGVVRDFLYLNFFNQLPIFLLGCFLYHRRQSSLRESISLIGVMLAWLLISALVNMFITHNVRSFGFLVLIVFFFGLVYVAEIKNFRNAALEMIGRQSYAMYIVQFVVLHFLQRVIPGEGLYRFFMGLGFAVSITYFIAVLLNYLIEKPVQRLAVRITSSPGDMSSIDSGGPGR